MAIKRSWIAAFAILACLMFAWATGAGRPYPAAAGGVIDPTCTSSSPCIEYDNDGSGPGIRGISIGGNGLAGSTEFKSTSATNFREGLIGNDISTSGGFNAGVRGLSVRGTGVMGNSTSGPGVQGTSSTFTGLLGVSNSGAGVQGTSSSFIGVSGSSNTFDAVQGVIGSGRASSFHAGVAGLDRSTSGATNEGVFGDTTLGMAVWGESYGTGTGVQGSSPSGVGVNVIGGNGDTNLPALSIVSNGVEGSLGNPDLIDACGPGTTNPCQAGTSAFQVDGYGDVYATGGITAGNIVLGAGGVQTNASMEVTGTGGYFKNDICVAGCPATATSARRVRTYALEASQPTLEDYGEGQLISGVAYVRLDPAFVNIMDQHTSYLVVVTPEGDSNGLYVTQKTLSGFVVRENRGGRSSLAFAYRIATKPYGSNAARLPMVDVPLRSRHMIGRSSHPHRVLPNH